MHSMQQDGNYFVVSAAGLGRLARLSYLQLKAVSEGVLKRAHPPLQKLEIIDAKGSDKF
jgi:hypothetical protein